MEEERVSGPRSQGIKNRIDETYRWLAVARTLLVYQRGKCRPEWRRAACAAEGQVGGSGKSE